MAQNPYGWGSNNGYQPYPPNSGGSGSGPSRQPPQWNLPLAPYGAIPPYSNLSGGYNPVAAYPGIYPQYGHAPSSNNEGYSYSSTYQTQSGGSNLPDRPNKRARGGPQTVPSVSMGAETKAWRNCSMPGCGFIGPGDEVEVHEGDRHLIFPNGHQVERSEEEERFARRKGPPPPIEGTNITLQTEEDIAKWIAERKAKWPSAKRVAEKKEEYDAAIARGEIPSRGRGSGGRGRGGRGGRRQDPASQAEDWGRPELRMEFSSDGGDRGGRGRGRGGRDRGRGRGRGGAGGFGSDRPRDAGWTKHGVDGEKPTPGSNHAASIQTQEPPLDDSAKQNPMASLVGYDTASEDDVALSGSDDSSSITSSDTESTTSSDLTDDVDEAIETEISRPHKPVCKFYARTGKCKFGDKCRFAHSRDETASIDKQKLPELASQPNQVKQPRQPQPPSKRINPFDRPGMLSELLATPIQNTLSQLSQTIRFLVANDMLENVELKPGDTEAQARQRNLVVDVTSTGEGETSTQQMGSST